MSPGEEVEVGGGVCDERREPDAGSWACDVDSLVREHGVPLEIIHLVVVAIFGCSDWSAFSAIRREDGWDAVDTVDEGWVIVEPLFDKRPIVDSPDAL